MMKAIVYQEYGSPDNLEFVELEMPAVKDDEMLVKVHASSINWHDWHFVTGTPFLARVMSGLFRPKDKVLGIDLAGRVEEVGARVTQFKPGDEIFGSTSHGCFAEYVCVTESEVAMKPAHLSFEEAAAVPGAAITALHAVRDHGKVKPGQKVLINGASGGVGTFALQIAMSFGAEVTGVCSTRNLDLVRSLGADHAIDYTKEDFTQNKVLYNLIFDVVAKLSFTDCKRALRPSGIYITSEFSPLLVFVSFWLSIPGNQKMVALPPKPPTKSDLTFIKGLLESKAVTPVIDRKYSLSEVPDALRYLEKGHARGKITLTI